VFKEGVETLKDLKPGMIPRRNGNERLRRSALSSTSACIRTGWCTSRRCRSPFIKDPREVVKSGDIVKVKVLEVEVARKRIALNAASG